MIGKNERDSIIGVFPFLPENPIIFDVGSNKGGFADIILEEFGNDCELHLFEPNPKLLSYTEIKYEYRPNIKYCPCAVFDKPGEIDFFYFENFNNELSGIFKDESWDLQGLPWKKMKTHAITIDDYCESFKIPRIDILKIDAEGSDPNVLFSAGKMIYEGRVKIIFIEYSPHYERAGNTFDSVIIFCEKHGYERYRYLGGNYIRVNEFDENFEFENYIITKFPIQNHSTWNQEFVVNTSEIGPIRMALEIGAFEGKTTAFICKNLLDKSAEAKVVVVDPLEDYYVPGDEEHPYFYGQFQRFKRNTRGLPVELHRGKSEDILPKLNALRFDLVYIDGNHFPPHPYFDGCWAFAITKIGGLIIFDDYNLWRSETKENIDKFLNEFAFSYEIISSGYQMVIRKVRDQYNEITQKYY